MVFLILKYVLSIVCTIVPLIVMFNAIRPLFKTVITAEAIQNQIMPIVKSLISGIIVFMLPTLFSFIFTELLENKDPTISNCFTNATIENVTRLKEKEEWERKAELSETRKETEEELRKAQEEQTRKNDERKRQREEKEQQKTEQESTNVNNSNDSASNSSSSSNASDNRNSAYGSLFVGDSRTVGFKTQINLKDTDNVYATSGGSMTAFNSDINQAIAKINSEPTHRYNLILNYGVNNLTQDWVSAYKNVIKQVNGKANILIVSVNPCNDSIARYCRNANIEIFNQKLQNNFRSGYQNVKYCDTYTPFKNTVNYTNMIENKEGIHYTKQGALLIYNKINDCLSSF